jgi:hypothetical protein
MKEMVLNLRANFTPNFSSTTLSPSFSYSKPSKSSKDFNLA